jgi:AmmeMemoRadiSam system protein B
VIGSTDLTHYGPAFSFTPQGTGAQGMTWAKEVNDRRMIQRMLALDAASILPEAASHQNACGAGAVAATLAAARCLGADRAALLEHTTSREVTGDASAQDAVGYAGIVFLASEPPIA